MTNKPFWKRRLEICYDCQWLEGKGALMTCNKCGWFLQAKTRAWLMHCPLNKW